MARHSPARAGAIPRLGTGVRSWNLEFARNRVPRALQAGGLDLHPPRPETEVAVRESLSYRYISLLALLQGARPGRPLPLLFAEEEDSNVGSRGSSCFGFGARGLVLTALVGLPVLGVAACIVRHSCLRRELAEKLKALRQRGVPTTPAELDEWYLYVPSGANAAVPLQKAADAYGEGESTEREQVVHSGRAPRPCLGERLPDTVRDGTAKYLASNSAALKHLGRAAAMDRCRFAIDLTLGLDVQLHHLSQLRTGVRLLADRSLLAANAEDATACAEDILAMWRLGECLRDEPTVISALVRAGCHATARACLEDAMSLVELEPSELAELQHVLARTDYRDGFWRGLAGDLANTVGMDLLQTGPGQTSYSVRTFLLRSTGVLVRSKAEFINLFDETFGDMDSVPVHEWGERRATAQTQLARLPGRLSLTALLLLPLLDSTQRLQVADAKAQTAVAALAVERYRLVHGKLPDTLAALVPDFLPCVPLDAFTGDPLKYIPGEVCLEAPKEAREPVAEPKPPPEKGESEPHPLGFSKSPAVTEDGLIVAPMGGGMGMGMGMMGAGQPPKSKTIRRSGYVVYSVGQDLRDDEGMRPLRKRAERGDIAFMVLR